MKKEKTTPPQKLITVEMTYKVKGHKDTHPFTSITFTTQTKHKAFKVIKKKYKSMYREIGCKMLTCRVTSYVDICKGTEVFLNTCEDGNPITFTKALDIFK